MFNTPLSMDALDARIKKLEMQNRALWSLLADAYAFRDEKNFAEFILHQLNDANTTIDAAAVERLQAMAKRDNGGPAR